MVLASLGGCGFQGATLATPSGDANADASKVNADATAGTDAMTVSPFCDPTEPTLVACYAFEGSLQDGSGHGHDPSIANNTGFAAGEVGSGLVLGPTTEVDVPDSAAFDVSAVTIEAWVKPNLAGFTANRAGVLDCNNQYGMFIQASGSVTCAAVTNVTAGPLASNTWSHVACTDDGATVALYINGVVVASASASALPTSATTGLTLGGNNPPGGGDPLVGMLDQVRLFKVARNAAQICEAAGRASCFL